MERWYPTLLSLEQPIVWSRAAARAAAVRRGEKAICGASSGGVMDRAERMVARVVPQDVSRGRACVRPGSAGSASSPQTPAALERIVARYCRKSRALAALERIVARFCRKARALARRLAHQPRRADEPQLIVQVVRGDPRPALEWLAGLLLDSLGGLPPDGLREA